MIEIRQKLAELAGGDDIRDWGNWSEDGWNAVIVDPQTQARIMVLTLAYLSEIFEEITSQSNSKTDLDPNLVFDSAQNRLIDAFLNIMQEDPTDD